MRPFLCTAMLLTLATACNDGDSRSVSDHCNQACAIQEDCQDTGADCATECRDELEDYTAVDCYVEADDYYLCIIQHSDCSDLSACSGAASDLSDCAG